MAAARDNAPNVVPITDAHLDRVCDIMVRSFTHEPIMGYTLPDADRRPGQIRWLFEKITRYAMRYGRADTTEDVRGFCIWLAPGDPDMKLLPMLRLGFAGAPFKLGPRALTRMIRFQRVKDRIHHQAAPDPHWYLLMVGVDPAAQGGGVASALLRPGIEQADAHALPCYLETGAEQNTKIFAKFGFTTAIEADVDPDHLHIWGMLRQPA